MNHFNEATTELFLLRVSAENQTPRVIVVDQRNQSRTAFSSLESALTHIQHALQQLTHYDQQEKSIITGTISTHIKSKIYSTRPYSQEEQPLNGHKPN